MLHRRLWPAVGSAPVLRRQGGTTEAMADAALGLMDALGWPHAHITGMSLGGEPGWISILLHYLRCHHHFITMHLVDPVALCHLSEM